MIVKAAKFVPTEAAFEIERRAVQKCFKPSAAGGANRTPTFPILPSLTLSK